MRKYPVVLYYKIKKNITFDDILTKTILLEYPRVYIRIEHEYIKKQLDLLLESSVHKTQLFITVTSNLIFYRIKDIGETKGLCDIIVFSEILELIQV